MAFKGHNRQGYCPLTITQNADGTTTETPGTGKLTNHVVSFTGTKSSDSSDLWAGDAKELTESAAEGTVQLVLSQLSLEDEAAFGGHSYSESEGLVEKEDDEAPFLRYAALGVGRRVNDETGKKETFFRVLKYGKIQMAPLDDKFQTRDKSIQWQTHSCQGTCYYNAAGMMRSKQDFSTFEAALADMKKFLNIPEA